MDRTAADVPANDESQPNDGVAVSRSRRASKRAAEGAFEPRPKLPKPSEPNPPCPRCNAGCDNTKFCYYNNNSVTQPRYYCKQCERHWTAGGTLRKVEAGAGRRNPRKKPAQRGKGSRSRSKATPSKSAGSECGDESVPADTEPEPPQAHPGAYTAEPPMTRAPPLRQQWPGKVGPAESTAGVGAAGVYSGAAPPPPPDGAAQRPSAHQGDPSQSYDDVQAFFGQGMDVPFPSPRPVVHGAGRHTDPGHVHASHPRHDAAASNFASGYSAPGHAPYYMPAPQHGGMMPMGPPYGPPEHYAMVQSHPAYPGYK